MEKQSCKELLFVKIKAYLYRELYILYIFPVWLQQKVAPVFYMSSYYKASPKNLKSLT